MRMILSYRVQLQSTLILCSYKNYRFGKIIVLSVKNKAKAFTMADGRTPKYQMNKRKKWSKITNKTDA